MAEYGFMIFWSPEGLGILCSRCDEEILHIKEGEEGAIEYDALARSMERHPAQCPADR